MHQYPPRKLYGFDDMELIRGPHADYFSEYEEWFYDNCPKGCRNQGAYGVGIMHNDWTARPWHLDEHLHPSNWTVERALRFMERRDPSRPFFLSMGFLAPHPPLQPPPYYFERYLRSGVPDPVIGDWETPPSFSPPLDYVSNSKINFSREENINCRAAYYGSINHVDDLLRRIFNPVGRNIMNDTIVIFTSDHGEMLGDHYMWRKSLALEPAARVPFLVSAPTKFAISHGAVCDAPATHADIMPTLLDMLDIPIPGSVDGRSLYPQLKDSSAHLRDYLHIEHIPNHQCVTDGKEKYIWSPFDGQELFFDLKADPQERRNLINGKEYAKTVAVWRKRLIDELRDRPEGFVKDGRLNCKDLKWQPQIVSKK
jgi:arylsulfatase A-like enzyme